MSLSILPELLQRIKDELELLLGESLQAIYLYGSRARGDARPDSDMDLLIVLRDSFDYADMLDRTIDLIAELSLEYDVVISRAFVTKEQFDLEMSPFLMNVRREAVPA